MARTKRKVNPIIPAPTVELETPSAFLAAGYVRLSTEDSGKLGADVIEAQKEMVASYIEQQPDILNMSAYIRKMALDGICVRLDLAEVRQLIVLLQRCSNNLNQYAKRANETGSVYAADIEDLQSRLEEIWELSRQSLAHLANIR